jgi:hypothetical protein
MAKKKNSDHPPRVQTFATFLKESAGIIAAIAALLTAIVGLMTIFRGGSTRPLFPTHTPDKDNCIIYKMGNVAMEVPANEGLHELYIIPSENSLKDPHLLVFEANGDVVGLAYFTFDKTTSRFILTSVVDNYCYEIPQSTSGVVQQVAFDNGNEQRIKLSNGKEYILKLLLLSRLSGDERWDKRSTDQSQIECLQDGLPILPGS